jgi:superfamily II DNA or RNA helicase
MMMAELTVLVASHNFSVINISDLARKAVEQFARKYIQWGYVKEGRQWVYSATRVYASATKDRGEFRFHINCLALFKEHLTINRLKDNLVTWIDMPIPDGFPTELPIFEKWAPREEQPKVIDYITSDEKTRSKFVNLQTGKGKSFCTMAAASRMKALTALLCKPMYIEKWLIDIKKTYDIDEEDIVTIQGGAQLMALLERFSQKNRIVPMGHKWVPPFKFILISNKTYQLWLKLYEEHGKAILDMGYECLPQDFFEHICCGLRVIDEVHQDFHLNFKMDLYTNVAKSVSLSATLVADDPFINQMYALAYPKYLQYVSEGYDKYISTTAVFYNLARPGTIRYQDPSSSRYSHNLYEQGILRHASTRNNYFALIREILGFSYFKKHKPGYKLMIFVASIAMATELTNHLAKMYPGFSVTRYVEDDEYVNVMESDIRVSTLLSSGTAVDIPGLQTTLLTVAVSSSQSNIQGLGRLRKMLDGSTPEFIWMTCEDIPPHIKYHDKKVVMLEPLTLSYKKLSMSTLV